ncbi:MAG: adenylyltransferase/cytidyltransferase family protein [Thermoplasmata archaeon]|nr:adenylyltransferase/cytidyltransferase family protein [Thermoplasmata archaeon]
MVRVMATGVFDILHTGHIFFLQRARELGDELVVVVARDSTVRKQKHEPITLEEMRRILVESLKPVDSAVLGTEGDMYDIVVEVKPDIIALGYDQDWDAEKIKADLKEKGLEVEVVRLPQQNGDLDGTRKIVKKILDLWKFSKKMERAEQ